MRVLRVRVEILRVDILLGAQPQTLEQVNPNPYSLFPDPCPYALPPLPPRRLPPALRHRAALFQASLPFSPPLHAATRLQLQRRHLDRRRRQSHDRLRHRQLVQESQAKPSPTSKPSKSPPPTASRASPLNSSTASNPPPAPPAPASSVFTLLNQTPPPIRLYQAHGYQPQGREESYYAPGVPALIFILKPSRAKPQ